MKDVRMNMYRGDLHFPCCMLETWIYFSRHAESIVRRIAEDTSIVVGNDIVETDARMPNDVAASH